MIRSLVNKYILVLLSFFAIACSGTRHLPANEKLYRGADVKIESNERLSRKKKNEIKATAKTALVPKPNSKFLGMRPKLCLYMAAGTDPKTKYKKWLQKVGEPPVLASSVKPGATSEIIDAKYFNIGIFKSYTEFKTIQKRRTEKIIYTSHIHKPYTVKSLVNVIQDENINRLVRVVSENTLIKPGEDYNLDKLKLERLRIDAMLKDSGYFYFNPDYLLFKADTAETDRTVTFKLLLKDSVPSAALTIYRINNVYIDQEFSLTEGEIKNKKDTLRYQTAIFLGEQDKMKIRPSVILNSVYLTKNEVYSRTNHKITLNRLMTLGNFKFVSVKFTDSDTSAPGYLDVMIRMTSMPKRTFRAEFDLVSKSNNYAGPRLNLTYLNRNTFNGAELLNLNLAGSFEAQLSGKDKNLYSYSYSPQVELYFPRFLVPFHMKRTRSMFVPKTRLSLSYNYLKRVNYFDMRTSQFIYGFKWKEDARKSHELNPVNVSYTSVNNRSAAFDELLATNPFLRKSYDEQFIAGTNYMFTYNEQVLEGKPIQYLMILSAETAGNLFSLGSTIAGDRISSTNPAKVMGSVYSQYAKLSGDARAYFNFADKNKLVLRVYAGAGKPYGNSSTLPYTKQFFSGGPNSIRAFHINSVGPGPSHSDIGNKGFLQLGGDVKLEGNAEYRFNIYKYFKGAIFADAGNIWLLRSNPAYNTRAFQLSHIVEEIAVGAGIGLRIDVSFFILRFDLAAPLRKPWLSAGERWVIDDLDFKNPEWRSENLILNVAIGYPF